MTNRKGMAVAVVLFFAFSIGIIMFFMIRSNTGLANQTRQTLYEMQSSYLAESAMQFAKLQIYLLPKEIYEFYQNDENSRKGNCLDKCDSDLFQSMALTAYYNPKSNYDLFKPNSAPDNAFPYGGRFWIDDLRYVLSNRSMKMVQDSYKVSVKAYIDHSKGKNERKNHGNELVEEFIVSRYSGR